ncbi:hypothetical protein D3C80_1991390 [compost metagenome]
MGQQPPGGVVLQGPEHIVLHQPLRQVLFEGDEPGADGPLEGPHGQTDDAEQQQAAIPG